MKFDLDHFQGFLNSLRVATKEKGVISLGQSMLGTQKLLMREIVKGLEDGVHEFVTLKARQLGISTFSLAFDLYYPFRYSQIDCALIVHDEPARDQFRETLRMYRLSLPDKWRRDAEASNRNQMVFENGSKIQLKIAGLRQKSAKSLGRSSALTVAHATEVAFWGDAAQINSLKSSFAKTNPRRFYHWESTANGFNHWERLWREAKGSVSKRAIFIGWWANELYRCEKGSELFKKYWGRSGKATSEERDKMRLVKDYYDVDIEPEQLAWYRYMENEEITDEDAIKEEFPWDEDEAFVSTGSDFFTAQSLTDAHKRIVKEQLPIPYRIHFGREFTDTTLVECRGAGGAPNSRNATLRIWEEPQATRNGQATRHGTYYVLGADPAHGSSPEANAYALALYRCWGNRMDQVAEFYQVTMSTHQFAWVIMYLAGAYEPCLVNVEINGPGQSVLAELQRLKTSARLPRGGEFQANVLKDVTRAMSQYMWRKIDSMAAIPQAMHTQSNYQMKERMLNSFKDYFERQVILPHSPRLIEEMKNIQRRDGQQPAAGNEDIGDDLVMAHALATVAWHDQLMVRLTAQGVIWTEEKPVQVEQQETVLSRMVGGYLAQIGMNRRQEMEKRTVSIGGRSVADVRREQLKKQAS